MTVPRDQSGNRNLPVQKRVSLHAKEIRALELAALGYRQKQIGEEIGLTPSAVGKMLQRTEKKLAQMLKEKGEQIKARQTFYLDAVYREAMTAWRDSQKDAETLKTTSGGDGGDRTEKTVRGQSGDPRFLDQARGALADIRRIWGLDEAVAKAQPGAAVAIKIEFVDDFFGRKTVVDGTCEPAAGLNLEAPQDAPDGHTSDDAPAGNPMTETSEDASTGQVGDVKVPDEE